MAPCLHPEAVNPRNTHTGPVLFRLLGKSVWFVGKMTVKHVLVPIAITAGTAIVLGKLAERLDAAADADDAEAEPNGADAGNGAETQPTRAPRSRAPKPMDA